MASLASGHIPLEEKLIDEGGRHLSAVQIGNYQYAVHDQNARSAISSIIETVDNLVTGGVKYIGKTTTDITDGSATNPIAISGKQGTVTAVQGDLVVKDSGTGGAPSEFIWDGSKWNEFGAGSALKAFAFADKGTVTLTSNGTAATDGALTVDFSNASLTGLSWSGAPTFSGASQTVVTAVTNADETITVDFTNASVDVPDVLSTDAIKAAPTLTATSGTVSFQSTGETAAFTRLTGYTSGTITAITSVAGASTTFAGKFTPAGSISANAGPFVTAVGLGTVKSSGTVSLANVKPSGTISMDGVEGVIDFDWSGVVPAGEVSLANVKSAGSVSLTNVKSAGSVSLSAVKPTGTIDATKLSATGTVSKPDINVTSGTDSFLTAWSATVSNSGVLSFSSGASNALTSASAALAAAPTFTGNGMTGTATFTGTGFTGTATFTGGTPTGTATFTGTGFSGEGSANEPIITLTAWSGDPTFTGTGFTGTPTFTGGTPTGELDVTSGSKAITDTKFTGTEGDVSTTGTPQLTKGSGTATYVASIDSASGKVSVTVNGTSTDKYLKSVGYDGTGTAASVGVKSTKKVKASGTQALTYQKATGAQLAYTPSGTIKVDNFKVSGALAGTQAVSGHTHSVTVTGTSNNVVPYSGT